MNRHLLGSSLIAFMNSAGLPLSMRHDSRFFIYVISSLFINWRQNRNEFLFSSMIIRFHKSRHSLIPRTSGSVIALWYQASSIRQSLSSLLAFFLFRFEFISMEITLLIMPLMLKFRITDDLLMILQPFDVIDYYLAITSTACSLFANELRFIGHFKHL
jgi:hypothetical protein